MTTICFSSVGLEFHQRMFIRIDSEHGVMQEDISLGDLPP